MGDVFLKPGVGSAHAAVRGAVRLPSLVPGESRADALGVRRTVRLLRVSLRDPARARRRAAQADRAGRLRLLDRLRPHQPRAATLRTNEYVHNFLAIDREPLGPAYRLTCSFPLATTGFSESLNPGDVRGASRRPRAVEPGSRVAVLLRWPPPGRRPRRSAGAWSTRPSAWPFEESVDFAVQRFNLWGARPRGEPGALQEDRDSAGRHRVAGPAPTGSCPPSSRRQRRAPCL